MPAHEPRIGERWRLGAHARGEQKLRNDLTKLPQCVTIVITPSKTERIVLERAVIAVIAL